MARSLDFTYGYSLLVTFLLLNALVLLSSSTRNVFSAEALPRPLRAEGSFNSGPSVVRNPFLNQNVELMGFDGNHHDLVHAIIGSKSNSLPSNSPTLQRKKMKRHLYANDDAMALVNHRSLPLLAINPKRRRRGVEAEAVIMNGNMHVPQLQIDHSLFSRPKELTEKESSDNTSSDVEASSSFSSSISSRKAKRDFTPPPGGTGSGGTYNTGMPYGRRTLGKTDKSGKHKPSKHGGKQGGGKHHGKHHGKHGKKGESA